MFQIDRNVCFLAIPDELNVVSLNTHFIYHETKLRVFGWENKNVTMQIKTNALKEISVTSNDFFESQQILKSSNNNADIRMYMCGKTTGHQSVVLVNNSILSPINLE